MRIPKQPGGAVQWCHTPAPLIHGSYPGRADEYEHGLDTVFLFLSTAGTKLVVTKVDKGN